MNPDLEPGTGPNGDERLTLAIGGMTCAACARRVEKALQKAPGVTDAVVNLATHQATVVYAPGAATPATIAAAVVDAGYRATPPSEHAADDEARALAVRLIVAAVAGLPVLVLGMSHGALPVPHAVSVWVQLVLSTIVLVVAGGPIVRAAVGAVRHGGADMNVLVTLGAAAAFGASVVATVAPRAMGAHHGAAPVYYEAAVAIVGFVLLGRWLEARARRRAGAALGRLRALVPPTATVLRDDGTEARVALDRLAPGDRVVVRPGQAIPADGEIVDGTSSVAEAVLTGEAMPLDKRPGDAVFAGTSNGWGRLVVRVTRAAADTSLAKITAAVESAMGTRAPIARLADRVAGWLTPAVMLAAAVTFGVWLALGATLDVAVLHAVAVLVVACPCALGLATPAALAVGLGRAAEHGALFRSAAALERLGSIDTVVVDKTGTLTEGQPLVLAIEAATGWDEARLLALAAGAEEGSEHPLAGAVLRAAGARGVVTPPATAFEAVPGRGVRATVEGHAVVAGSPRFVREAGVVVDDAALAGVRARAATPVVVAVDGAVAGVLAIGDAPRAGAVEVVRELRDGGIEVVMLTGDARAPAEAVAATLGVARVEAEALPADKAARVQALRGEGRRVAMVGDGVNDAPALAAAEVGVAMGSATDVAAASAEVVLLRDELGALAAAVRVARRTLRVVRENLWWALGYNVVMIPAAAGALVPLGGPALSPMLASAAMAGSSVAVVMNSLRLRRA
jgi:Cu+-exporting ATPase